MKSVPVLAILATVLCAGIIHGGSKPPRPNVLLICVDDLKPALGCYGDRLARSPNVDRLAKRGVRFDLAYCNQAVCAPSRNNLLVGSRSTTLGIYSLGENFRLAAPTAVTLPQYFRRHGYRAESIGKVLHTGHGNRDDAESWSVPSHPDRVVEYRDPANSAGGRLTREEAYFSNRELGRIRELPRGAAWERVEASDSDYADGRIADEAIRRLQAARPDQPFFLAVGFVKPHLPFTAPKRYWDLHDPARFPLAAWRTDPEGAPPVAGKRGGEIVNYEPLTEPLLREEKTQRELIHGYYACVSYMDAQLGRVLDTLDRTGLAKNTIVALWGDHGWHLGDHGYWTKHTKYEQANRIPLLVAAPGVTRGGAATRQLAETVDLFPTLTSLAGLPAPAVPQKLDGVDLTPVLRNPRASVRDHAYHCFPRRERMGRAIRTGRHRLVEWKKPGGAPETAEFELYDYERDPEETRNLAPEQPEVVQQLRAILARHPEAARR